MEKIVRWFRYSTLVLGIRWSDLNRLGQSRLLKSSYYWFILVPVVARIFAEIERTGEMTILGYVLKFDLTLPFSWKVFFFASVAFALASLIYAIYCPEMVRKYAKFSDFEDEGKGDNDLRNYFVNLFCVHGGRASLPMWTIRFLADYCGQPESSLKKMAPLSLEDKRAFPDVPHAPPGIDHHPLWKELYKAKVQDKAAAFWWLRGNFDSHKRGLIIICMLLYFLGFALLLYVVGENILYVIRS